MARVALRADLDIAVAAGAVRRWADRAAIRLAEQAAKDAPPAKMWQTAEDEKVRPTHRDADRQVVPANVKFRLDKPQAGPTVRGQVSHAARGGGRADYAVYRKVGEAGVEYADRPRDENLTPGNKINCRCQAVLIPGMIGATVRPTGATAAGPVVRFTVETRFPHAGESEVGTMGEPGLHWMAHALREFAARNVRR